MGGDRRLARREHLHTEACDAGSPVAAVRSSAWPRGIGDGTRQQDMGAGVHNQSVLNRSAARRMFSAVPCCGC